MLSANSGLRVGTHAQVSKTADFTTSPEEFMYNVDIGGSNVNVTLHPAAWSPGQLVVIKLINGIYNTHMTVTPSGSDTIDGLTSPIPVKVIGSSITLRSDGTSWWRTDLAVQGPTPVWYDIQRLWLNFSTAATSNSIIFWTVPAGTVIHAVLFRTIDTFQGGAISDYKISCGIAGNLTKFMPLVDVDNAPSGTNFNLSSVLDMENYAATTDLYLQAVSVGDNLDQASQGRLLVSVLASIVQQYPF
jgi:hypothetical protein